MDAQEARIYTAIIISSVVIGSVITYIFISLVRQHRRTLRLQKESRGLEINVLEKERKRIAGDLHDELSSMVAAIKMGMNNLDIPVDNQEQLEQTNETIDSLSTKLRDISFNLMPATLLRKGLFGALQEQASRINRQGDLHVTLIFPNEQIFTLSEETSINIYRIVQEIVHNTIKHARASELKIRLEIEKELLILATIDDGAGFDYDAQLKESSGLGLRSIASRVDILNGEMAVSSRRGAGTSFTIEIPFKK